MAILKSFVPRYYQRDARDSAFFGWMECNRQLLHLGTGGGKTSIMADMIGRLIPDETCLILADQDELCTQPRDTALRITGTVAALEKGQDRASLDASLVVGSSQTLTRKARLERFPRNHFDKIFIDECHRGTERDIAICDYFETAQVLGVTATPFKANHRDLSRWYEGTCFSMPLIDPTGDGLDLIGEGFAPPLEWCVMPEEFDLSGVKTHRTTDGMEFDEHAVDDIITPKFKTIVEFLGDTAKGRHIIVALPLIRSSVKFAEVCRQLGLRAMHVDGNSADRDTILKAFNEGHFDILCNSNVLSTGVDLPTADYFLPLKPMRSAAFYQQFLGRVFRCLPGIIDHLPEREQAELRRQLIRASAKPKATVCDPLFLHDELGVMHVGKLIATSEEDAKALFEKAKKLRTPAEAEAIARHYQKEKEKKLKEALERAALRARSRTVDADFVGALLDDASLLHYEPTQKWELKPATDRQKELLANLGVNVETVKFFGTARMILDALNARFRSGLSTLKQVRVLKQYGQEDAHLLTFRGASERMDAVMQQKRAEREGVLHG